MADPTASLIAEAEARGVRVVRLSFADQHGLLRGKTVMVEELPRVLAEGCGCPSSLLLKDLSHRTVFDVYDTGGGVGLAEMQGAGDVLMIPDPASFHVLPWAPHTGWLLCDLRFPNGTAVEFSTRGLLRRQLERLDARGFAFKAGAELEFHLFKLVDPKLAPEDAGQPGTPPEVALVNQGYQYLTEQRYDEIDPILDLLRENLQALDLPLRSLEIEFGPSQCEMTFGAQSGLAAADLVVLARSAVKQVARRHGYHATFMCRPRIPAVISSGWHLHQSLVAAADGANLFHDLSGGREPLSELGMGWLAGLLAHAAPAASFANPTINAYRRFRAFSNAPVRANWGCDNRGVMVRLIGDRIENRVGEPAANPYLYLASQIAAGLDGIDRGLHPGASADLAYSDQAALLPGSLETALDALAASEMFQQAFGAAFVDYWIKLKRAEIARFMTEVTEWEQREYFSVF